MNIAVVIAGGSGRRAGQEVPKQFINVYDTPNIIYTLKNLQDMDRFDEILVIGPEGWENYIYSFARQCGISKMNVVVPGGDTRQHSIHNCLNYLKEHDYSPEDVVCLVDANRPLIPHRVFADALDKLSECDGTFALEPCYDTMYICEDGEHPSSVQDRSITFSGQTPEVARLGDFIEVYERATSDGILDMAPTSLLMHYGKRVTGIRGSKKSFKITTAEDFDIFRAMLGNTRIHCMKTDPNA